MVAVVQIRWVQPVVMPLAPLLDGLSASLFLFWGTDEAGLGPHTGDIPPKSTLQPILKPQPRQRRVCRWEPVVTNSESSSQKHN